MQVPQALHLAGMVTALYFDSRNSLILSLKVGDGESIVLRK
jgi:hypothetical protein